MKALVADFEKGARTMLSRLIERYLGMVVLEADCGLDALAAIEEHVPDVVILDADLPELDVVTLVRMIREGPGFERTPVVVTARQPSRALIDALVGLGVRDIYLKPYDIELVQRRLARVRGELRPRRTTDVESHEGHHGLLLVDGDANFRRFALPIFNAALPTDEASTGAHALRLAATRPYAAICVGNSLFLLNGSMLATALRRQEGGDRLRIIRVSEEDDRVRDGPFDDWLPRLWVPSDLSREFRRVVLGEYSFGDRMRAIPEAVLAADLASSVQQTAGVLLGASTSSSRIPYHEAEGGLVVRVTLDAHDQSSSVTVTIATTRDGAGALVAMLTRGQGATGITGEDCLREMANTVAGRLQESLAARELTLRMGLPTRIDGADPARGTTALCARDLTVGGAAPLRIVLGLDEGQASPVEFDPTVELF